MARSVVAVVLAAAAWTAGGCFGVAAEASGADDLDPGLPGACFDDSDCTLAGPSCCECPSFAVSVTSGWDDSCEDVDCMPDTGCPALEARCTGGHCVAACAPQACDLACDQGFAVDAAGCQVCACQSGPLQAECQLDGDCVQVAGDCCGCARGGVDVAVPVADAEGFVDGLMCTGAESCPELSTCDPLLEPRCLAGRCQLGLPTDDPQPPPAPDGACGRSDLPPCPAPLVCVLNGEGGSPDLGTCAPPP